MNNNGTHTVGGRRLQRHRDSQVHMKVLHFDCEQSTLKYHCPMLRLTRLPTGEGYRDGGNGGKLEQKLAGVVHDPLFQVFIDVQKSYDSLDRGRCMEILQGMSWDLNYSVYYSGTGTDR